MKIENIEQKLSLLYGKAIKEFKICINDEENNFLKDEVNIPLENIKIIEKDVRIVFTKRVSEQYLFEVSLLLFEGDEEIGKYVYVESEKGEEINDSLAFY
jgi:hypothetical protein